MGDLWTFDPNTTMWFELQSRSDTLIPPRSNLGFAAQKSSLFIFGGQGNSGDPRDPRVEFVFLDDRRDPALAADLYPLAVRV